MLELAVAESFAPQLAYDAADTSHDGAELPLTVNVYGKESSVFVW